MTLNKDDLVLSIIEYCRSNRVSTTEVADALNKTGVLVNCKPLTFNHHVAGRIFPVFTSNGSNFELHDQIRLLPKDSVLMIFTFGCDGLAILGELVTKYALLYRGARAIVVNGLVRDFTKLRRDNYPIWCEGWTPLGCSNQKPKQGFPTDLELELRERYEGAVAVCDDGGVTVIENSRISESTIDHLRKLEIQEDIWAFCLNTLKWDTKRIVCDKEYLKDTKLFSDAQVESLKLLQDQTVYE